MDKTPSRVRIIRKTTNASGGGNPTLRIVAITVLVLVGIVVAWKWKGRTMYGRWTRTSQIANAERLARTGRLQPAAAAAQSILQVDPVNLRATALIADIADRTGARDVVRWRERMVALEPWNTTNIVMWAQAALRFNDHMTAMKALSGYPTNTPPPAFFHETAGAVALRIGDRQQAEVHFSEALRLDPTNLTRQLNLAKLRISTEAPTGKTEARKTLERLADNPATRHDALGVLAREALAKKDWKTAIRVSQELAARTNAPFDDQLLFLEALRGEGSPTFTNQLRIAQARASGIPADLARMVVWMNETGYVPQAMAWTRSLSVESRQDPRVGIAIADTFIALQDWLGLRNWVRSADWGALNSFRIAYDAFSTGFLASPDIRNAELEGLWAKAVTLTKNDATQLEALATLADRWRLPKAAESTRWAIVDSENGQENALMSLQRLYLAKEDTMGQYRVAQRLFKLKPDDLAAQNNVAYLGLLLGVADSGLHALADELHRRSPRNPIHASTYAFSQYRKGQAQAAVDTMAQLEPSVLRKPAMAAMYGLFLAKAGDTVRAREFLKLAENAKLLPEEEKLVTEARGIARSR